MSILKQLTDVVIELEKTGFCGLQLVDNELRVVPSSKIKLTLTEPVPMTLNEEIEAQKKIVEEAQKLADELYFKAEEADIEYRSALEQLEKESEAFSKLKEEDGLFIQFYGRVDRTKNINIEQAEQESKSSATATQSDSKGEAVGVPTLDQDNATAARTAPNSTGQVDTRQLMDAIDGFKHFIYEIYKQRDDFWEVRVNPIDDKTISTCVFVSDDEAKIFREELEAISDKIRYVKYFQEEMQGIGKPHFVQALIMIYAAM